MRKVEEKSISKRIQEEAEALFQHCRCQTRDNLCIFQQREACCSA